MKLKEFLKDTLQVSKGAMKIETKGIIEGYRERYDVLRKDKSKPFRHDVYTMTPGNRVAVHIKVPSETVDKFYYDVLLELSAEKSATVMLRFSPIVPRLSTLLHMCSPTGILTPVRLNAVVRV